MLMVKKGSQHNAKTSTMITTMRVTLRSDFRRLVRPARVPADFTWKRKGGMRLCEVKLKF